MWPEKGVGRVQLAPTFLALVEWLQVEKYYDLINKAAQKKLGGVRLERKIWKEVWSLVEGARSQFDN